MVNKGLYVIFDCVSKEFGEVLTFYNDDEAKRAFTHSCLHTGFQEDLALVALGGIGLIDCEDFQGINSALPVLSALLNPTIVCTYRDVENDVNELRQKRYEDAVLYNKINSEYSGKEFTENVQKLARYFSKKDKWFNK